MAIAFAFAWMMESIEQVVCQRAEFARNAPEITCIFAQF